MLAKNKGRRNYIYLLNTYYMYTVVTTVTTVTTVVYCVYWYEYTMKSRSVGL